MESTIQSNFKAKYIIKSVLFCVVFIGLFIVVSFAKDFIPKDFERLAHGILGTLVAFLTTMLFLKFDRKKFSEIGLTLERNTVVRFFGGAIVGFIIMGLLAMSVLYITNVGIEVNPGSNLLHFLLMTAPLLPLAFMEELGFRAYPLEILKDKIGIRGSILITSILFALSHLAPAEKYQGIDWATIVPNLALLVFAIICIELYIRRKLPLTLHWQKQGAL